MIDRLEMAETERYHGVAKALRIKVTALAKESDHPYDGDVPELENHRRAVIEALGWSGLDNFDLYGYVERDVNKYGFVFREVAKT